jgi:hypothetical protein
LGAGYSYGSARLGLLSRGVHAARSKHNLCSHAYVCLPFPCGLKHVPEASFSELHSPSQTSSPPPLPSKCRALLPRYRISSCRMIDAGSSDLALNGSRANHALCWVTALQTTGIVPRSGITACRARVIRHTQAEPGTGSISLRQSPLDSVHYQDYEEQKQAYAVVLSFMDSPLILCYTHSPAGTATLSALRLLATPALENKSMNPRRPAQCRLYPCSLTRLVFPKVRLVRRMSISTRIAALVTVFHGAT